MTTFCQHNVYTRARMQISDGSAYSHTDGVHERGKNERQSKNDCKMKTVS